MKYEKSLFIFRRDLRLNDNTALIEALKNSKVVIPAFVFDPRQIKPHAYQSLPALQFMVESLNDLDDQLKRMQSRLQFFEGLPDKIVERMIQKEKVNAVYTNYDYTPFSKRRDSSIKKVCKRSKIDFIQHHDLLLNPPEDVRKQNGGVYTIYTPYMRNALSRTLRSVKENKHGNYSKKMISWSLKDGSKKFQKNSEDPIGGGRQQCLKILNSIHQFKNYDEVRNFPALDATTKLSAHNKFGTCSIREVFSAIYKKFGLDHTLIRELVWRDFFTQIGFHFPHVLGNAFKRKYVNLKWENDKKKFKAWCEGNTGFPIVDAGMRELNATGFMHNRVRMITASFLVKDLRVDWRWGERYFATKLIDYDPLINNGNWQWVASTGCDAQPYFRIFNPWLQQKRYDPECQYIKKWVPELKSLQASLIHQLQKTNDKIKGYPSIIVDHKTESQKTLNLYKRKNVSSK